MAGLRSKLIAHRGYTKEYPENSLQGLRAAIEVGARFVEFDVQLTADQVPVLFHDRTLARICAEPGKPATGAIHDYTLEQLCNFSFSEFDRLGYKYVANQVTTLKEACVYLSKYPTVFSFVEIKRSSLEHFGIGVVLEQVLPVLYAIKSQAVVISFSLDALVGVRERSSFPIGVVVRKWKDRKQRLINQLKPEFLFTDIRYLPKRGKLSYPHSQVAVYECTDASQAVQLFKRGVDLIETFAIAEMFQQITLHPEHV